LVACYKSGETVFICSTVQPPTLKRQKLHKININSHVISLSTKSIEGRAMSSSLVTTDLRIDAPPPPQHKVEIDSMSFHFLRSELMEAISSSLVTTDLRIDAPPPQHKVEIDSMSSHFLRSELREER
jgi:hypothetical protein